MLAAAARRSRTPADLYLEGSDQHRGWFHSSLLTSVALNGRAPYKGVLTHGFTVDDKGRKMSKSLGNVVAAAEGDQTLGADVLRLWVAATDYANEMSVSDEILKRMSESYRRMRNTVRFLLGNLAGFDPARDALPADEMVAHRPLGAARARAQLQEEIVEAYRKYEFHLIYQKVHNFCVVDLGGFYLDMLKDRLYTTPTKSAPRRSAQTALYHIAEAHGALARADPVVHGRGDLALPAGRARRVGVPHDLGRAARTGRGRVRGRLGRCARACGASCCASSRSCASRARIGAPLDAEVDVYCARRASRMRCSRSATSCASC